MSRIVDESAIDRLGLGGRPLLVCDVDEVVLEFVAPFGRFLASVGYRLLPRSFRLTGNVVGVGDGEPAKADTVRGLIERFFESQGDWQGPVDNAAAALSELAGLADIVFLTAMPPRHAASRRALLDRHGLPHPMIASESDKGPIVARLHAGSSQPIAFIDDIARNLASVAKHVPQCLLINLMADPTFRALAPAAEAPVRNAANWSDAHAMIAAHFDCLADRRAAE